MTEEEAEVLRRLEPSALLSVARVRKKLMSITMRDRSHGHERRHRNVNRGSHKPSILRMNLVQSEERTMYERGTGAHYVDFCSVTIDGSLNDDVLQQRLRGISRKWEELQHMEIELRAQLIARVEIMEMQKNFDAKIKEHATANTKLKEQL